MHQIAGVTSAVAATVLTPFFLIDFWLLVGMRHM